MSIDLLFRNIKEIQFKADKLLKKLPINEEDLLVFAALSSKIKSDLQNMEVEDEFHSFVKGLVILNPTYMPELNSFEKILGLFTFRWYTKRCVRNKREVYFIETIRNSKVQFTHVEYLLKAF